MSVFKAREWWSAVAGYEEFHDIGCLCVGNIDNSQSNEGEALLSASCFDHNFLHVLNRQDRCWKLPGNIARLFSTCGLICCFTFDDRS